LPLQKFKDKNVALFSHNDLDGIGAILVYKYYIEPLVTTSQIYSCSYDDIEKFDITKLDECDTVLFTDITPTKELYEKLIDQKKEVYVYDHHQSAYATLLNVIREEDYFYFTDKCGTKIFFDEITRGKRTSKCIYQFCQYVDTYDLWHENSVLWKEGKALHNILWGSVNWNAVNGIDKHDKFINNQLEKFHKGKNFYFSSYEQNLALKAEEREREFYTKAKNSISLRVDGEGNEYGYFECPSKISLICNRLLKELPQLKYVVGHGTFADKNGAMDPSISLRSVAEVDVSIIAGMWGGGGHKQASGILFEDYEKFMDFRAGKIHLI
jgi:oligoribonuclease NrnB/cAMP/cGMP phosphodiesterase (DHH superfamily)